MCRHEDGETRHMSAPQSRSHAEIVALLPFDARVYSDRLTPTQSGAVIGIALARRGTSLRTSEVQTRCGCSSREARYLMDNLAAVWPALRRRRVACTDRPGAEWEWFVVDEEGA